MFYNTVQVQEKREREILGEKEEKKKESEGAVQETTYNYLSKTKDLDIFM